MTENIIEKNLNQIARYNPVLAQKIANADLTLSRFELYDNGNGSYNLNYNEIWLHENNPEQEAKRIYDQLKHKDPGNIHVLFGLGLGYLFKKYADDIDGKVILYEPNLDLLRFTLEVVDFSKELSKDTIRVVNSFDDLKSIFFALYTVGLETSFSFLSSYMTMYGDKIHHHLKLVSEASGIVQNHYKTLKDNSLYWSLTALENLPKLEKNHDLEVLRDKFTGKPAVILSAGPSLDKTIDYVKKHRDKILVFCVGAAFRTAAAHEITPDFLVITENKNTTFQITSVKNIDIADINLILKPTTFTEFFDMPFKRRFNFYAQNDFLTNWLSDCMLFSLTDYVEKGSVSVSALYAAKILGCDPIIVTGQDLAYSNGQCYSKNNTYSNFTLNKKADGSFEVEAKDIDQKAAEYAKDEEEEKAYKEANLDRAKNITENLYYVKGQDGTMIPTDPAYALFIKYFEEVAKDLKNKVNLINCSPGGAYLEGFEHWDIQTALEQSQNDTITTENIIESSLKNDSKLLDKDKLINKTDELLLEYDKCVYLLEKAVKTKYMIACQFIKLTFDTEFDKNFDKNLDYFHQIESILEKNLVLKGIAIKQLLEYKHSIVNKPLDQKALDTFAKANFEFFVGLLYLFGNLAKTQIEKIKSNA